MRWVFIFLLFVSWHGTKVLIFGQKTHVKQVHHSQNCWQAWAFKKSFIPTATGNAMHRMFTDKYLTESTGRKTTPVGLLQCLVNSNYLLCWYYLTEGTRKGEKTSTPVFNQLKLPPVLMLYDWKHQKKDSSIQSTEFSAFCVDTIWLKAIGEKNSLQCLVNSIYLLCWCYMIYIWLENRTRTKV